MSGTDKKSFILAGDIGGTKTKLGLFTSGKKRPALKYMNSYQSGNFDNLEKIIDIFLSEVKVRPDAACFGVAGPVKNGCCRTTNLPWNISGKKIEKTFQLNRAFLINDLTAMASSVPFLTGREVTGINNVRSFKKGNISVIAPGTGLGQALLVYSRGRYIPVPSEGGHTDFAPKNELETGLLRHLAQKYGHVSIERILSGPGLYNIYEYLVSGGICKAPAWLVKRIKEGDPAKIINDSAREKGQRLCLKTIDIFISILGAAAGNLALTGMTTGGVFLGGGIPPRILWRLKQGMFLDSFVEKGRFRGIMEKIPVKVILNDDAALLGAAIAGLKGMEE